MHPQPHYPAGDRTGSRHHIQPGRQMSKYARCIAAAVGRFGKSTPRFHKIALLALIGGMNHV